MKTIFILAVPAALLLAGCGRVAPLEPSAGRSLPVKPLMASATPTAEDLLDLPPNARPRRVDELAKRSEPRSRDRFDLAPPGGGAVPLPVAADTAEEPGEKVEPQ